jgi:hypothetical protein
LHNKRPDAQCRCGKFAIALTAIVAMLFVLDDASPSLILHGWAAARALGIDSAIAAQQLRCQANVLSAMRGIRIVCAPLARRWALIPIDSDQSLTFCLSIIFSENRFPARTRSGAKLFGIML